MGVEEEEEDPSKEGEETKDHRQKSLVCHIVDLYLVLWVW